MTATEDPNRHLSYLQQCLSSSKKPLGLFLGAGCPMAIRLDEDGQPPLIPDIAGITQAARTALSGDSDLAPLLVQLDLHFSEDPEGWETLGTTGEAFARFCPALESVGIAHYVSGPSSYTPDNNFILGACPGVEGYLVAAGCCGSGVAASGGIARAISELVADGESSLDLEPFRADRFGEVDAFDAAWLERCSAARVAKSVG